MNTQRFCRTDFRLHAMDMWPQARMKTDLHHWMLRDRGVRRWIANLALEYRELRQHGGDPLDGAAVTGPAMIDRLGLSSYPEPTTTWAALKFCARISCAFTRECWHVNGEILRLQARTWRARHV